MVGEKHTLLRAANYKIFSSPANTSLAIKNYQELVHRCALFKVRGESVTHVCLMVMCISLSLSLGPRRICILVSDAAVAAAK
jgi:hypothetical protein